MLMSEKREKELHIFKTFYADRVAKSVLYAAVCVTRVVCRVFYIRGGRTGVGLCAYRKYVDRVVLCLYIVDTSISISIKKSEGLLEFSNLVLGQSVSHLKFSVNY